MEEEMSNRKMTELTLEKLHLKQIAHFVLKKK